MTSTSNRTLAPSSIRFAILFAALAVAMGLAGCSGGLSQSEDARSQQARDAKALEDLYSGVVGKWDGIVQNDASGLAPFAADLTVYVIYIQDGTNPDGSSKLRPTLRGRFRPKDFASETDVVTLVGDYDRSGRFVLTGQNSAAGAAGSVGAGMQTLSVRGQAGQESMNVEIARENGVWGIFRAKRTSRDAVAPATGAKDESRERLLKFYSQLEGRYAGVQQGVDGNDIRVEVSIVVVESPIEGGGSQPTLGGVYRYVDVVPGTATRPPEWNLNISYNAQTGAITMLGTNTGRTAAASISLVGNVSELGGEKYLKVTVRDGSRLIGTLSAKR